MITLRKYSESDLSILERSNTSEQKKHVGGPETEQKLLKRHRKYVDQANSSTFQMFIIEKESEPVGYIGYWERNWNGKQTYETGWGIFPEFQGQGLVDCAPRLDSLGADLNEAWNASFFEQIFIC